MVDLVFRLFSDISCLYLLLAVNGEETTKDVRPGGEAIGDTGEYLEKRRVQKTGKAEDDGGRWGEGKSKAD